MPATYVSTITAENGGYVVNPSTTITLNGKVRSIFEINSSYNIDKFTHVEFDFVEGSDSTGHGICMYEQPGGTTDFTEAEVVNCIIIGSSDISNLANVNSISDDAGALGGSKINVALGKLATQSSTYSSGDAGNAVDGDTGAKFNFQNSELNTVTSTASEIGAWWMVDLLSMLKIKEIVIYKRVDGYSGRLLNYDIEISNNAGGVVWSKPSMIRPITMYWLSTLLLFPAQAISLVRKVRPGLCKLLNLHFLRWAHN
jgi:hypothetical protein